MEGVIEDLRARLRSTGAGAPRRDLSEVRLEVACTWGSGHLLVTGSNRAEVDSLLDRVIRKTDPMGTIRARAGDPVSIEDRLIALLDSESEVTGHLDRRRALLQLLARAQEARKSIFVVVDDADAASIEQLEKLRTTIEVAPDAIERLRLVLVGSSSLPAKLDAAGARALSSRITSRIRVGAPRGRPTFIACKAWLSRHARVSGVQLDVRSGSGRLLRRDLVCDGVTARGAGIRALRPRRFRESDYSRAPRGSEPGPGHAGRAFLA